MEMKRRWSWISRRCGSSIAMRCAFSLTAKEKESNFGIVRHLCGRGSCRRNRGPASSNETALLTAKTNYKKEKNHGSNAGSRFRQRRKGLEDDPGPIGTLLATSLGAVVGALGGPVGAAVGATAGASLGAGFDLNNIRIGSDFIDDVSAVQLPNRYAVVAEIDEDWTTPVDTRIEALGGLVFRRALKEVNDTIDREDVAAMKADRAQFKAELAQARADRKAKLQSKIDELDTKIQVRSQNAKEKREAFEKQQHAKAQVLKKRAGAAGRAIRDLANTQV